MKRYLSMAIAVGVMAFTAPGAALAQGAGEGGDAAKGKRVFNRCKACHMVGEKARNKIGPVLTGVVGRKAGEYEKYRYSKLNQTAGEAGLVWTKDNLFDYLVDPTKYLKAYIEENGDKAKAKGRSKMIYKLNKEQDRKDVIAYLDTFSEPKTN